MALYIEKVLNTVDAVQYSNPMTEELKEFLESIPGLYYFKHDRMYLYTIYKEEKLVNCGDFIIRFNNGMVHSMSKDEFEIKYTLEGGVK
jgi:hypothetical protein